MGIQKMKALVLEENGKLICKEVPKPVAADDECLIHVKASGICNSDIYRAFAGGAYFYPLIMGHEFSGEVVESGKDATDFKVGDRVVVFPLIPCGKCEFCEQEQYAQCVNYDYYGSRRHGGFAEYVAVKKWNLLKVSENISFAEACLIEPIAVAIHAIRKVNIDTNEKVVIFGAGLIGITIANYLRNTSQVKEVIVIDRNQEKLDILKQFEIDTICSSSDIDYSKIKAHLVFEACGAPETFLKTVEVVRSHGRVVWVGNITGDLNIPKQMVSQVLRKELQIIGSWNSSYTCSKRDDWHLALNYLSNSQNKKIVDKLITHKVSLDKAGELIEILYKRKLKKIDIDECFIKGLIC